MKYTLQLLAILGVTWVWALAFAPTESHASPALSAYLESAHPQVVEPEVIEAPVVQEHVPAPWPAARQVEAPTPPPPPTYDVVIVRMLVTACSPQDAIDQAYYARHGYEGAIYNIAADLSMLPRGTRINVPGYMEVSYPGTFWEVDSAGGSIIRRATRRGALQIDVKFRTEYSALKWGSQWLNVEVQIPRNARGQRLLRTLRPHIVR